MKEYVGTNICSSEDDHKNYLYKFDTPNSLIQMWVEANNIFFNKLFKENVGIVHTTYGNPNANFKLINVEPYSVFEEMNSSTPRHKFKLGSNENKDIKYDWKKIQLSKKNLPFNLQWGDTISKVNAVLQKNVVIFIKRMEI